MGPYKSRWVLRLLLRFFANFSFSFTAIPFLFFFFFPPFLSFFFFSTVLKRTRAPNSRITGRL